MKKNKPTDPSGTPSRYLLRVDPEGRQVGIEDKEKCHTGEGIWHSAYLVMVFDEGGRLMQARRSPAKTLWPGYWDGTVASHFYPGEDQDLSIRQRISEEIGVTCGPLDHLFDFSYQSRYRDVGIEKEVCRVYRTSHVRTGDVAPNAVEVSQFRFSALQDVSAEVKKNAGLFTPWFVLALERYLHRGG